jgi:acyl carrier protein
VTPRELAVAEEIRRLAQDELGIAVEAGLDEELASRLDSLALLSLVVAVEDRFRVALAEEDTARARSLGDLARLVASRTAEPVAVDEEVTT